MDKKALVKSLGDKADSIVNNAANVGGLVGGVVSKAAGMAADAAGEGAKVAVQKAGNARTEMRRKKYSPLFEADIVSSKFDMPRMIIISDGTDRKSVDVCINDVGDGSIAWLEKVKDMEVLHIHDDCLDRFDLEFQPPAMCDMAFYVDPTDPKRYLAVNDYYEIIKSDKISELQSIAHSLGAKRCEIRSYELEKTMIRKKKDGSVQAKVDQKTRAKRAKGAGDALVEWDSKRANEAKSAVLFMREFEGSDDPQPPQLHWFKHDKSIQSLIEARCSKSVSNPLKQQSVDISSSTTNSLSVALAAKVDAVLKRNHFECDFHMEDEAMGEARKRLVFTVEF